MAAGEVPGRAASRTRSIKATWEGGVRREGGRGEGGGRERWKERKRGLRGVERGMPERD